ncbi:hypothetical protein V2J09_001708 [Rumex salicifolius]
MGRVPCCEKDNVKRGQWTPEEDNKLSSYIAQHGTRNWRLIPKNAALCCANVKGLQRCGKSCRLRWTNYLRPDLKHGQFTDAEEQTIVKLHSVVGNRWSLIAAQLPGRTDNDVKNYWNTKLKKKLSGMGIDPVTHKPFSHLMAEIATTLAPPHVTHLAEAALGCFKDEMLHVLTKKRVERHAPYVTSSSNNNNNNNNSKQYENENVAEKIKLGLSRAIRETVDHHHAVVPGAGGGKAWEATTSFEQFDGACAGFGGPGLAAWDLGVFRDGNASFDGQFKAEGDGEGFEDGTTTKEGGNGSGSGSGSSLFGSECGLWDLSSSDDLVNSMI